MNDSTKVISDSPFSRAELGLPDDAFVFCCFNNSYKITPDLFDIWMRLLHAVEGSVLWLPEGNATAARNLRLEAEKRGISPDRLVFAPRMEVWRTIWRAIARRICFWTRFITTRTPPPAMPCGPACPC